MPYPGPPTAGSATRGAETAEPRRTNDHGDRGPHC